MESDCSHGPSRKKCCAYLNTGSMVWKMSSKKPTNLKSSQGTWAASLSPSLAGVGNLILTRKGNIKLVDINNISTVTFSAEISLDDKGYPVCDKSIEVISLIEKKLLLRPIHMNETIYRTYLDPQRMKKVRAIEKDFTTAVSSKVF